MNSARLKTAMSYYDMRDTYSIPELLKKARQQLDPSDTDESEDEDEDSTFLTIVSSCTGLLQMAMKRLLTPLRLFVPLKQFPIDYDVESTLQQVDLISKVKTYQIEGDTGNLMVHEIDVNYKKSFDLFLTQRNVLKSLVLSQNCANLIWIWSETTRIILITESKAETWSLKQMYSKILSNMALTDSILIGHPYYWHPVVRRRLNRAIKHFKKLYSMIGKQETCDSSQEVNGLTCDLTHQLSKTGPSSNRDCIEMEFNVDTKQETKIILTRSKFNEKVTGQGPMVNEVVIKWREFSKKFDHLNSTTQSQVNLCPVNLINEKNFDDFMDQLTLNVGTPQEDAISSSLGPYFRLDKINRNLCTVHKLNSSPLKSSPSIDIEPKQTFKISIPPSNIETKGQGSSHRLNEIQGSAQISGDGSLICRQQD